MTLWETPGALWSNGMPAVAVLVASFIIFIPAILLAMKLLLCIPLHLGHYKPWMTTLAAWIFRTRNWSMVEVFIIGAIVSLVKIADMATVAIGPAFWAYSAFTICFTVAIANLDRYQCWEHIEALERER
jgi:paraquat-inducible protein A